MFSFKNEKWKKEKDQKSKPCHPPPPPHCHYTPWQRPLGSGKLARRCRWKSLIWPLFFYKMNDFLASLGGFVLQDECFQVWYIFLSCFCTNPRKLDTDLRPICIITIWSNSFATVFKNIGLNFFFEMFDCSKRPNWSGYFWWHVIINNPSASKDLIEG